MWEGSCNESLDRSVSNGVAPSHSIDQFWTELRFNESLDRSVSDATLCSEGTFAKNINLESFCEGQSSDPLSREEQ